MSKLSLIIKREYLSRVKKKSFIIISLLAPIGMLLCMLIPSIIAVVGATSESRVAVVDKTEEYSGVLSDNSIVKFVEMPNDLDESTLRATFQDEGFDAYLIISGNPGERDNVRLYSKSALSVDVSDKISNDLCHVLKDKCLKEYEGHSAQIDSLFQKVNSVDVVVSTINIDDSGEENESFAVVGMVVSMIAAMMIYAFVLLYGNMVMQGIMEEKTNRIIEVLISSVKPFDLMMGKIVGIALVALTQFGIWLIVGGIISVCSSAFFPQPDAAAIADVASEAVNEDTKSYIFRMLASLNYVELLGLLVFYFIGGYLLYASLFACVGSAVENPSEGQQLTLPIMMPLFIALYLAIYAARDPNSAIVVWGSIIPFTSPIVMMARLPFSVPGWQIALSVVLLVLTFIGTTWFAARIYRVGILMYGKKVTFKELIKWFRQSN